MSSINWFEKYSQNFNQLEALMREQGLWAEFPPSMEAMQSTMPFCVDSMPIENWLQFIFLPKMREIVAAKQLPPGPASISPIVEESYKDKPNLKPMISLMKEFDEISRLSHLH